ncbi:uncharacterized protein LOC112198533 isoform X2 [Rosa chinensis]|uniref:uncharacterized protein LOC112198533 isoform X2 n=1 Tax=Rosa chinensis TaxID=74649 RepID=UPI001AD8F601|nr:uncharacterized protein LOC112198533 isoform X2 [Rosa chinensis]
MSLVSQTPVLHIRSLTILILFATKLPSLGLHLGTKITFVLLEEHILHKKFVTTRHLLADWRMEMVQKFGVWFGLGLDSNFFMGGPFRILLRSCNPISLLRVPAKNPSPLYFPALFPTKTSLFSLNPLHSLSLSLSLSLTEAAAMEANRTPKRPLGIRTRSQSEIQLHRTRSGRVINSYLTSSESDRKRPRPMDSSDGNVLLNSLIKDLRVKRVFSQTYKPPENLINDAKSSAVFSVAEPDGNSKEAKSDQVESCGNRFDCSAPDMDKSKSKEPENLGLGFLAESPNSADKIGGGFGSDPESSQTSPPEARANGVELKIDNETKMVLKNRKRVFKAPSSFSYRRMLPYLKDITKDNSCMLDFCELTNRECHDIDCSTQLETVQVSSHVLSSGNDFSSVSPEYVPKSPPIIVVDQCLPKPPVDGQNEKIDLGVSCEVQKLNVSEPFRSSAMEDSQINTDGVMVMCTDDNTPVQNVDTAVKDDIVSSSEDQNVKDINPQSSSIMDDRYSSKDDKVVQHKENSNQAQNEGIRKTDMGYPCKVRHPNHVNEQRVGDAEEALNQICDLNEESIQMTPPDAEILDKLQVEVKGIGRAGYLHQSTDQGLGKTSSGINHIDASWVDLGHECSPKRKPVLNPCSRLKLFKSPGSVSYKRLLPFLMNMEKRTSVSSHFESTVKDLEQRQPPTPSQLGPPMDKSNVILFHTEPGTTTPQLTNANGSSNVDGPNLTFPKCVSGSQMSSNVQKEMHGQHSVSGKQSKLDISPDIVVSLGQEAELPVPILGPNKTESPSEKDGARISYPELPVTRVLSLGTVKDCIRSKATLTDGGKPVEANYLGHNSSEIDATVSSVTQVDAVRKGILKRNPRGCRGLCTCLNCASFRLQAERAFEFSQNQMQDAEEVALDLMAELSKLRKLLEKSAVAANDDVVTLNEVKSACRKASEAEVLARNRLGEMNYDLNIHCRITCLHGPRVRFANHSEEKVIPKAKCSSD